MLGEDLKLLECQRKCNEQDFEEKKFTRQKDVKLVDRNNLF